MSLKTKFISFSCLVFDRLLYVFDRGLSGSFYTTMERKIEKRGPKSTSSGRYREFLTKYWLTDLLKLNLNDVKCAYELTFAEATNRNEKRLVCLIKSSSWWQLYNMMDTVQLYDAYIGYDISENLFQVVSVEYVDGSFDIAIVRHYADKVSDDELKQLIKVKNINYSFFPSRSLIYPI